MSGWESSAPIPHRGKERKWSRDETNFPTTHPKTNSNLLNSYLEFRLRWSHPCYGSRLGRREHYSRVRSTGVALKLCHNSFYEFPFKLPRSENRKTKPFLVGKVFRFHLDAKSNERRGDANCADDDVGKGETWLRTIRLGTFARKDTVCDDVDERRAQFIIAVMNVADKMEINHILCLSIRPSAQSLARLSSNKFRYIHSDRRNTRAP